MPNLPYFSPELLREYQRQINSQASPATAKRRMAALKRFFGWAHQEGHIPENPIQEMLPPLTPGAQIITTRAPRFKLSNVFKLGIPLVLVILVFLLVRNVKLPTPFLPAPAKETTIVTTTPVPTPVAEKPVDKTAIIAEVKEEALKLIETTLEWASFEAGNLLIGGAPVSSLTLSTGDTTDGDITINPDGSGIAHFLFEGTGQNFLNAQAPNLTSGSLYYGVVANNATGYDLIRLQSGLNPVTRFSVDALGNTDVGGDLNVDGDISTNDTVRVSSAGALTNITGYSQTSGNFSISQGAGDSGTIIKKASALADLLTLTLDERGKANSIYSTLTLKRYDGAVEGAALYVDEGNAIFDGQLQLGRYSTNPTAIGQGTLIYNTSDTTTYLWNGTSWIALGGGSTSGFWQRNSGALSPTNITDDILVGATATTSALIKLTGTSDGNSWINTGNFGIGTTAPGQKLDVTGNLQFSGALMPGSAAGTSGQFLSSQGAGTAPVWTSTVPASSIRWDQIINPTANLSLAMSTYTTAFNWATGTEANNLFSFTTDASANGTGSLVNIQTGTSSTVNPLRVRAGATEGLFVNSSGNVGIGTTSPGLVGVGTALTVSGASGDARGGLELRNPVPGTASVVGGLRFYSGSTAVAVMDVETDGNTTYGKYNFYTKGADGSPSRMVITSTGNVGIGTTGPEARLHLANSASGVDFVVENSAEWAAKNAAGTVQTWMWPRWSDNIMYTNFGENGWNIRNNASTSVMFMQSGGNVGIGNTSPTTALHVGTNAESRTLDTGDALISSDLELDGILYLDGRTISNPAGTASLILPVDPITTVATLSASNWLVENTANVGQAALMVNQTKAGDILTASASGTPKFTITNAGNVGIGTTDPGAKLEVNYGGLGRLCLGDVGHGASWPGLANCAQLSTTGYALIQENTGAYTLINKNSTAGYIGFRVANVDKMVIDQGGNVGIGTTSPTYKLSVSGGSAALLNNSTYHMLADAETDNLVFNGDFEQGQEGWKTGSTTLTSVTGGYSGNYALEYTGATATLQNDDYIPVDPTKDVFELEGWFKKTTTGSPTPGILYFGYIAYDASKVAITTSPCGTYCYFAASGYTIPNDGNWHKFNATTTGEGTAYPNFPVGTKFVRILVFLNYAASTNEVSRIDHVTLKRINFGPLFVGNNFSTTNLADQNQATQLYTTSSNNFIITPPGTGNVGIGTTSPSAQLEVNGKVTVGTSLGANISAGQVGVPDGGKFISAAGTQSYYSPSAGASEISLQTSLNFRAYNGGSPINAMYIATNGNVGIGITAPQSSLHIFKAEGGVGTKDATITLGGYTTQGATIASYRYEGDSNSRGLMFSTRNTGVGMIDAMTITGPGNVGIGTTSPGSKLDVSGTVTATDLTCTDCLAQGDIGASAIGQGELKTTTGSVSASRTCGPDSVSSNLTLPGGEYGFYPQTRTTQCANGSGGYHAQIAASANNTSFVTNINISNGAGDASGSITSYAQQRYIQGSPPYDIDGYNIKYFVYMLWNKELNMAENMYLAEDPPWEYNGKDPGAVPHPFFDYFERPLPSQKQIVLVDPEDYEQWKQKAKENKMDLILYLQDYYELDEGYNQIPISPITNQPIRLQKGVTWGKLKLKANPYIRTERPVAASTSSYEQADLAEYYPGATFLTPGDIVEFRQSEKNETHYQLEASETPASYKLAGVISTSPSTTLNNPKTYRGIDIKDAPLALLGRVPVKVSTLNGPIKVGDPITSTQVAGIGGRATRAGTIIGTALQSLDPATAQKSIVWDESASRWKVEDKPCSSEQEKCYAHDKILVFLNLSWYDPDVYLTNTGELVLNGNPVDGYTVSTPQGVTNRLGALAGLVSANIKAGAIVAKEAITDSLSAATATVDNLLVTSRLVSPVVKTALISPLPDQTDVAVQIGKQNADGTSGFGELIIEDATGSAVASIDTQGNATFSGTLEANEVKTNEVVAGKIYADEIVARNGYFGETNTASISGITREEIEKILRDVEQDQQILAQASTWDISAATDSANLNELAVANLYVTQQAAVNALSVTSSLAVGADLVLQSTLNEQQLTVNSIDTLSAPLSIQSLAMAPVEIMAGKVRVDTNGDVTISGNLFVAGKIESSGLTLKDAGGFGELLNLEDGSGNQVGSISASGSAEFNSVTADRLIIAGAGATPVLPDVSGEIQTNATVGSAIIPAGITEITIRNPNISDYTLVYITSTSSTQNNALYVKSKGPGFFTVGFSDPITLDVTLNWWVIDSHE